MKIILLTLVLTVTILSQTNETTYINGDSLKIRNIQLFDNWDYKPGDDSTWALKTFSSVGWVIVDSRLDLDSIKVYNWDGIGWFRKTIVIDSSLINKTIALTLNHYGASQLYINGKLINKFGKVSKNSRGEEIYYSNSEPLVINFDSSSTYLFAVRYSNHLPIDYPYLYDRYRNTIGFYATFKDLSEGINFFGVTQAMDTFLSAWLFGIFIAISVIYFLLFLFYSQKKEYLYYTIFIFSIALAFLNSVLDNIVYSDLLYFLGFTFISTALAPAIFLSVLAFLYQIFYGRMLKLFRYLVMLGIAAYILQLFNEYPGLVRTIYFATIFVISVEILRVIFLAIKHKKNNAWVIGAGVGVYIVGVLSILIFILTGGHFTNDYIIFILLFSIPTSMSIYLARSSSQTNKNLEAQLTKVKRLSDEAIEQEKRTAKLELEAQLVRMENDRKKLELEEARKIQLSMLPISLNKFPDYDICFEMRTATEVGGDYYDFSLGDNNTLNIVIGDATGHGMKAGLMVATFKSLFSALGKELEITEFLKRANDIVRNMKLGNLFMSMCFIRLTNGQFELNNAGMPPCLHYRNQTGDIERIIIKNMPLGAPLEISYESEKRRIESGDIITLMSDGLEELFNEKMEMLGIEKIMDTIVNNSSASANKIAAKLFSIGDEWRGEKQQNDDITFVVIKVK